MLPSTFSGLVKLCQELTVIDHNSLPYCRWLPAKRTRLPTAKKSPGDDDAEPGLRFASGTVPADVPSVIHGSDPLIPSLALKNSFPPTFDNPEISAFGDT